MSLSFDADTHTYRLDGQVLPSVTTILAPLSDYSGIPEAVLRRKAQLGTAVHAACQMHAENDLDEEWLTQNLPEVVPYLEAWKMFLVESQARVHAMEVRGYHPVHRYAGTLDLLADIRGERWLIDIKTTVSIQPAVGPQTAAYAALQQEPPARRGVLQLQPTGRFKLKELISPKDWPTFLALLTIHHWKAENAS